MTNRKLKQTLLSKLNISQQALSQRIQKIKKQYSVTTEDATYIIAQQEGIILDKYLSYDMLAHIRGLIRDMVASPNIGASAKKHDSSKRKSRETRVIFISKEFSEANLTLSGKTLLEAKEMASLYPFLYIFENSIREVIDKVLTINHGDNWFENCAPSGLIRTVQDRMADEKRNSWHQRRGARLIHYLDMNQLSPLISKFQSEFVPNIIPSVQWFSELINEVYQSRCVLCHMNPLSKDNILAVKLRYKQWQKQIKDKTF